MTKTAMKMPPQATDVEDVIIGSILIDKDVIYQATELISPEVFYNPQNAVIYAAILEMYNQGSVIDTLTVINFLKSKKQLQQAGGVSRIASLTNLVASTAHFQEHCLVILEKYMKRKMIEIANLIIGDGYDDSVNCFDMLNTYNKLLSNLEEGVKQVDIDHIKEVAIETVKEIKQAIDSNNEGKTIGLPTFSKTIDEMSGGFINGEVSVIAGRPGEGKTAALLQSLINIANKSHRIGLISLEMSKTLLTKRMVSNLAKINGYKLRDGKLSEFEYNEVLKAVDKLMEKQVFITDDVYISMRKMRAIIRKFVLTHKCEIVFIDYLQLIESEEQGKREDQVNFAMMRNFQKIAREFNIPIVILCQLSRNDNKRPTIESLRGGGIEQAAGLVVILYDENYLKATGVMDVEMLAIVGKARHGRTGDVTILFNKEFQTIEEVASYAGTYKPPLTTADNEPLF